MEILLSGDHTLSSKNFRTTKQSLEAKRSLGAQMERFDGSWVFLGAKAVHMWQISILRTFGYLTLHFWHPALQQLCTSQGRVCCFVYSW